MGLFKYAADMQVQLAVVADELQVVRQQLEQLQANQAKSVKENLMSKVEHLQEKITDLSGHLSVVKDRLVETAAQAVSVFKEKGKAGMCRVVQKGISGMKSALVNYRGHLVDVMMDYQKTADQIDSIGDELKQAGNSISNVGRLLAGKGTKEVSDEKTGVSLTRVINKHVKKAVENLQKDIASVDRAFEKLDRLSGHFDVGKNGEKKLTEYKPLVKIGDNTINGMEEQDYNMVDNVLNNGVGEKLQKEEKQKEPGHPAARSSLKERLAEKKVLVSGQGKDHEAQKNIKNSQREM